MPLPHEAWTSLVSALLSGYALNFQPPLEKWELAEFGSHHYFLSLPDSDVDFQLQLWRLPPGLAPVDVTVTIGECIRRLAASWPSITGVASCRFGLPDHPERPYWAQRGPLCA